MSMIIGRFLAIKESEDFNIYDKFAYLIKSKDGDDFYFKIELVERELIT